MPGAAMNVSCHNAHSIVATNAQGELWTWTPRGWVKSNGGGTSPIRPAPRLTA